MTNVFADGKWEWIGSTLQIKGTGRSAKSVVVSTYMCSSCGHKVEVENLDYPKTCPNCGKENKHYDEMLEM